MLNRWHRTPLAPGNEGVKTTHELGGWRWFYPQRDAARKLGCWRYRGSVLSLYPGVQRDIYSLRFPLSIPLFHTALKETVQEPDIFSLYLGCRRIYIKLFLAVDVSVHGSMVVGNMKPRIHSRSSLLHWFLFLPIEKVTIALYLSPRKTKCFHRV